MTTRALHPAGRRRAGGLCDDGIAEARPPRAEKGLQARNARRDARGGAAARPPASRRRPALLGAREPNVQAPQGPSAAARGAERTRCSGRILKAGLDSQQPQGACMRSGGLQISPGTIFNDEYRPAPGNAEEHVPAPRAQGRPLLLSARCPRPRHRRQRAQHCSQAGTPGLWV